MRHSHLLRATPPLTLIIALPLALALPGPAHAGAALCAAVGKNAQNNNTDLQYFLRWGDGIPGWDVSPVARRDYEENKPPGSDYAACRDSGDMPAGYFTVIRFDREDYAGQPKTTYAFGYGNTPAEADQDARAELGRRDWSWKKSDPVQVVETGAFGGAIGAGAGPGGTSDYYTEQPYKKEAPGVTGATGNSKGGSYGNSMGYPESGGSGAVQIDYTDSKAGSGSYGAGDTQARLDALMQRLNAINTRIGSYGSNYSDAAYCRDMSDLYCVYVELDAIGREDPSLNTGLGAMVPTMRQSVQTACGKVPACATGGAGYSGSYGPGARPGEPPPKKANINFEMPSVGIPAVNPNDLVESQPAPRPSGNSGSKLAPGRLAECSMTDGRRYAISPCQAERMQKKRDLPPPPR